ncbi:MAG: sigma-54 interaction domain-containing protein [Allosphingosinicella sp.]|uniref:sigma-54 interaction domain-containing protein n=1 Tax=Allosphingosinicella sp. TaxID=2823234 RepID=UPI0039272CFB
MESVRSVRAGDCGTREGVEGLIVGESQAIVELRRLVRQVAPSNASVLITGPSGSGKEMVARAIHAESRRAAKSYVPVNCGAIPRDLLESELFGHEKGAFTGAHAQHRGRFEEADGGTLFLDEIGDMPHDMQVKLLRVLEERAVSRVGGRGQISVDARIVSATHRDIDQAIDEQRFREDLFYRLSVFPIELPSLAERAEDVPLLVRHFLRQGEERGRCAGFTAEAMDRMAAHGWPGNVRELRNAVERANILFTGQTVGAEQVELILHRRGRLGAAERAALWQATEAPAPARAEAAPAEEARAAPAQAPASAPAPEQPLADGRPVDLKAMLADFEQRYIEEALNRTGGIVAEAARLLSLQRTTLIEKMRKYDLARA